MLLGFSAYYLLDIDVIDTFSLQINTLTVE